jgi:hypothetical protein
VPAADARRCHACQDEEQDRYLDSLSASDRARLLSAIAYMQATDAAEAEPMSLSDGVEEDDREYRDPDFVEGVVRKLLNMPRARQVTAHS